MDFCLSRNQDGTYSVWPFFQSADIRFVSPTLRFASKPFRLWLMRIDAADPYLMRALDWIDRVNTAIFGSSMRLTTANTSIGKLTWTRPIAYKLRKAIVCMRPGRLVVITHLHCGARLAELTILQVARLAAMASAWNDCPRL